MSEMPNQNPDPQVSDPKVDPESTSTLTPVKTPEQDVVTLEGKQYAELLDYMSALEAKVLLGEKPASKDPLDDIVQPRRTPDTTPQEVKLDDMSNTQLAQFILGEIKGEAQNIRLEIETLKVMREVDEARSKHPDFDDYYQRIYELGRDNPTLSIAKAYKLAKAEAGENPEKVPGEIPKSGNLPKRPVGLPSLGEHPRRGVPTTSVAKDNTAASLKDAAELAWDKLGLKE